jgi:predicted DNA-binding ribbon-helix-helix protein
MADGRPEKHSLTLRGHRTSVSLERPFWEAFRAIARAEGKALNALAAEIDAARGPKNGLASAIRLHVFAWRPPADGGGAGPDDAPDGGAGPRESVNLREDSVAAEQTKPSGSAT